MAIQAAARTPQAGNPQSATAKVRVLRIGIVQGGRIIEERLIRSRSNISIGWSSKATFAVPSEALPKQWMLFELTPKGYVARFADAMDARIAVGNEVIALAQLKQAGRIRRQGNAWLLLLDERSRGKINVGDLTILFQFVTPPPLQPRPRLPASVRGSWTTGLDWAFTLIGGASFLVHLVFVLYLRNVDWPRKPDIEEIPDRFVQMVVKAKPPEAPKPTATEDKTEDTKVEKAVASTSSAKKAPKPEILSRREGAHRRGTARKAGRAGAQHRHPEVARRQGRWVGVHCGRPGKGRRGSRPGKGIPRGGRLDRGDQRCVAARGEVRHRRLGQGG